MSSNAHDVPKMVGIYKKLFVLLVAITFFGISVALLHIPLWIAVLIALSIIVLKSKIVLDSFQHLLVPRSALVILFGLTAVFFIVLLLLPLFNHQDRIVGTQDISKQLQMEEKPVEGHHHGD